MLNKEHHGYLAIIVLISLIIGAFGGAFGSFFLRPYLEATAWGKNFLALPTDIKNSIVGETTVVQVDENSATIDVVKKVSPSVVSIVVTKELDNIYNLTGPDIFDFWGFGIPQPAPQSGNKQKQEIGGGTGFIIGEDGLIITNKHVVADEAAEYTVVFNDGKKYEAKVLARDTINDVAMLKIEAMNLPVAELGDADKIEVGQTVIAIGNALGEYRNTVTRGVVSGINRRIVAGDNAGRSEVIDGAIQTDAAINQGNSGGPLVNIAGQVIGINTAVNWEGQSLGFAIPINPVKSLIESVKKFGKIVRPWLGVRYVQLNEQIAKDNKLNYNYGAIILRGASQSELAIIPGSPADKAGLVENDIILEVNGQKIDGEHSLGTEIAKYKVGEEVDLKVFHKGKEENKKIKLEERTIQ